MPLAPGTRLGSYEVIALIGSGGMGEVYRAHDNRLGRDVAIKVLPAAWSTDRGRVRRLNKEARAAASLNHPHICTIFDVGSGEAGEPAFIAMELLEGESLRHRLMRGSMDIAQAVDLAISLADALEAAHGKHLIHRDIKPANVFLGPRGAKIVDFGLAKGTLEDADWEATQSETLTATGDIMGTLAYMSPEQLRGEPLDGRTDVFSLGLVLYEMATGQRAFHGASTSVIAGAILHTPPIPPRHIRPALPSELERILLKAMEKDREQRYQTAAELKGDLKRLQRDLGSTHAAHSSVTASIESRRRWPWLSLAIGVAAIVLLLVGVNLWRGESDVPAVSTTSNQGPHRLVVLPFDNVSGQPSDQWLAGAFADALTLGLRDADNLILVNRARVLELGGSQPDNATLARIVKTLAVRYYVDGTYQRVGDDIRVAARLINAGDGTIAVQESRTDRFANLLQLQDDLSQRFATALDESPGVRVKRTASLAAYQSVAEANDLYLAGQYLDAIERLQRSIQQDETYAEAWALLGKSYGRLATPFYNQAGTEEHRQALRAALRAVALNPGLYEAHVSLALAYVGLFQFGPAEDAAEQAIKLNPRLPEAYEILGTLYTNVPYGPCDRRVDSALAERLLKNALELDPLSITARHWLGAHLGWSQPPDEGPLENLDEEPLRTLLKTDVGTMIGGAAGLMFHNRLDEAEQLLQRAAQLSEPTTHVRWVQAAIDLRRGHPDAERRLAAAVAEGPVTLREMDTAALYGAVGNPRMAAVHLDRLFRGDPSCTSFIEQSPAFVRLRSHPEIQAVISKYRPR